MRRIALLVLALAGCSDGGGGNGTCHGVPDGGTAAGATLGAGTTTMRYGSFTWGENNDCPAQGSTVVSVTISGAQTDPPAESGIALCLPRPDRIGSAPVSLSDTTLVQLVGASGTSGGCLIAPAFGAVPTGTVTFAGFCTTAGSSFTMTFAGSLPGTRSCADAGPGENVTITLGGTALVAPR